MKCNKSEHVRFIIHNTILIVCKIILNHIIVFELSSSLYYLSTIESVMTKNCYRIIILGKKNHRNNFLPIRNSYFII